jgi:hypothetical protein
MWRPYEVQIFAATWNFTKIGLFSKMQGRPLYSGPQFTSGRPYYRSGYTLWILRFVKCRNFTWNMVIIYGNTAENDDYCIWDVTPCNLVSTFHHSHQISLRPKPCHPLHIPLIEFSHPAFSSTLKMEALVSSETLVLVYQTILCHLSEEVIFVCCIWVSHIGDSEHLVSSRIQRHLVWWKWTDVSEEHTASTIRIEE